MGERQHDPDKDRIFVRELSGKYSLKDELGRLRAMPRVIKGKELKLDGGPQHFSRDDGKAGDVAIVHNNCVHQHFNASPKEPARALVIKTKPMYLFMNMLFQHTVQKRPTTPSPTQG